jgi:hypothetical protein
MRESLHGPAEHVLRRVLQVLHVPLLLHVLPGTPMPEDRRDAVLQETRHVQ